MTEEQKNCKHDKYSSSTKETGPYCCECGVKLVSLFSNIPRETPAGAVLYAMYNIKEN